MCDFMSMTKRSMGLRMVLISSPALLLSFTLPLPLTDLASRFTNSLMLPVPRTLSRPVKNHQLSVNSSTLVPEESSTTVKTKSSVPMNESNTPNELLTLTTRLKLLERNSS
jgi:hypothetical protein